jgi:hypothetical protein
MNADAGAQCLLGEVSGVNRTIAYHPPLDPFRVAVLVAVGFGIGCARVRSGASRCGAVRKSEIAVLRLVCLPFHHFRTAGRPIVQ